MRTGIGYDIHRFSKGRKCTLGGVSFDFSAGLEGHSDADVLLHAVCDAILGAAALGDIGRHFPDTSPEYRGISSLVLLEKVNLLIREKGYEVNNLDITVICEEPKITSRAGEMADNISRIISVPAKDINIKGTTNEGVGGIGRGEAAAAVAVATIIPTSDYERQ